MIRRFSPWIPAVFWAGVLFFLSSRSWDGAQARIPIDDSVVHLLLYLVFGVLLALGRWRSADPPSLPRVLIIGLLYALSDEVHQLFVPGRTFDPLDLVADGLGILIGLGIVFRWTRSDPGGIVPPDDRPDDASSRALA